MLLLRSVPRFLAGNLSNAPVGGHISVSYTGQSEAVGRRRQLRRWISSPMLIMGSIPGIRAAMAGR
jgi:hypothetical protein